MKCQTNRFTEFLRNKKYSEQTIRLYLNELEKIDIELFKKETEEYNKLVSTFNYAKNCDELNLMLLDTFDKMGYSKPWQGNFDEHMSDKNATLRFE